MGKQMKKAIAILCAFAMVVSSLVTYKANDVKGDTDYSQLTYSTITMSGDDTKSLDYCMVSNNLEGFGGLWYGDGGITLQIVFSGAITSDKYDVTLNGTTPNDSVMTLKGNGIVKFNPNNLANNAYSDIVITTGTQTLNIVIKKGNPGEASSEEITTQQEIPSGWMSVSGWKWAHRQNNGTFIYEDGADYNSVTGITALTAGNGADVEIKNEETTDLNKVGVNVINPGTAGNWGVQVHVNVEGLDATKLYSIKLLQDTDEVYSATTSKATQYRTTLDLGGKLSTGEGILSLSVEEMERETGTVDVKDITITPETKNIEENKKIYAHWTNPDGTEKAYAYIGSVDPNNGAMASNGWNFNTQAGQPMTAIDSVNRTVGNATAFEPGSTQKLIVEAYDASERKIGYGEIDITLPDKTQEEKDADAAVAKINTAENLALGKAAKRVLNDSEEDAATITDGNKGTGSQKKGITAYYVDLGEVKTIGGVLTCWEASNARAYDVEVSNDNETYTKVAEVTGLANNVAVDRISFFNAVDARYVRVTVTEFSANADAYGLNLFELGVFAPSEEVTTVETTTEEATTEEVTTEEATTEEVTTEEATTEEATTEEVTTEEATTEEVTTQESTTEESTTEEVTTEESTTEEVTTQEVTSEESTSEAATCELPAPEGFVYAPGEGVPYHFAWAPVDGAASYNVYIDGEFATNTNITAVDLNQLETIAAGKHIISVKAVDDKGAVSVNEATADYDNSDQETTQEVTTEEASTEEVTTEEVTTEEVTTQEVTTEEVTTQEVTTEQVTTQEVTTQSGPEMKGVSTYPALGDQWYQVGDFEVYEGASWSGSTLSAAVDENSISVRHDTCNVWGFWAAQVRKRFSGLEAGATYTVNVDIYSDGPDGKIGTKEDNSDLIVLAAGETGKFTTEITADGNGNASVTYGISYTALGTTLTFSNFDLVKKEQQTTEQVTTEEVTTQEVTSQEVTSQEATSEQVTTQEATTGDQETTTVTPSTVNPTTVAPTQPVTTKKVTVAKTKATKASKKLASKKIKVSLKKVKGAKGYQLQFSKAKKFNKKNIIAKKTVTKAKLVKKAKFTIKNKKFKNRKKIYVRARAFKKVNGKKIYGKWSKAKKVKVK